MMHKSIDFILLFICYLGIQETSSLWSHSHSLSLMFTWTHKHNHILALFCTPIHSQHIEPSLCIQCIWNLFMCFFSSLQQSPQLSSWVFFSFSWSSTISASGNNRSISTTRSSQTTLRRTGFLGECKSDACSHRRKERLCKVEFRALHRWVNAILRRGLYQNFYLWTLTLVIKIRKKWSTGVRCFASVKWVQHVSTSWNE